MGIKILTIDITQNVICNNHYFCALIKLFRLGQKKLIRFNEIKNFANVLEYPNDMQGKWHEHFNNQYPITLELACGKGEYTVGLGKLYPNRNFIGIDIKGNRIWRGAKTALDEGLNNIAFVRSHIDKITDYFIKDEVSEIWITFPDPQLRNGKMKKRLTHPRFLRLYQQILESNGTVNLKTDSPDLYEFTKTVIQLFELTLLHDINDLYALTDIHQDLQIKTHYEGLNISGSGKIHYLQFRLDKELAIEKDTVLKEMYKND